EPWLAPYNRLACQFQTPNGVVTTIRMKPLGWKNQIVSPDCAIGRSSGVLGQNKSFLHYVGWMSGQKNLRLPVAGEVIFLTSPFHRTGEAFRDAEDRHVEPLEGGTVVAWDWARFWQGPRV